MKCDRMNSGAVLWTEMVRKEQEQWSPSEKYSQWCSKNCVPPLLLIGSVKNGSIKQSSTPWSVSGLFGEFFGVTWPLDIGVVVLDLSESGSKIPKKQPLELFPALLLDSPCFFPFRLAFDRIRSRKLPFGLATPVSATNWRVFMQFKLVSLGHARFSESYESIFTYPSRTSCTDKSALARANKIEPKTPENWVLTIWIFFNPFQLVHLQRVGSGWFLCSFSVISSSSVGRT